MSIVIESLASIAIISLVVWALAIQKSLTVDRQRQQAESEAEVERQQILQRDRFRYQTHEMLRCLGCDTHFPGPLTSDGCPGCKRESLVITEREYLESHVDRRSAS